MLANRYKKFARLALSMAEQNRSQMRESIVALILDKNRVVSVGYNSFKTSPMMEGTRMSMFHAECDAIARAQGSIKNLDMVVARARRSKSPGTAKPCPHCSAIIEKVGIRKVVYTLTSEGDYDTMDIDFYHV